ncbi:MAG: hypothetical protein HC876_21900 [Chloroflexaceae bacterium]|nr:hypothetical protein [Chloroflexaceae bacterium]
MAPSLEAVLHMADQLPPLDQARLIEHLSRRLALAARTASPTTQPGTAAWARFFAVSDDIRATHPDANSAARLEADRRERDTMLGGQHGADDVHP